MTLKDAVERAPVLPIFIDYIKLNTVEVEESGFPQSKKLWTTGWKLPGWQDAHS